MFALFLSLLLHCQMESCSLRRRLQWATFVWAYKPLQSPTVYWLNEIAFTTNYWWIYCPIVTGLSIRLFLFFKFFFLFVFTWLFLYFFLGHTTILVRLSWNKSCPPCIKTIMFTFCWLLSRLLEAWTTLFILEIPIQKIDIESINSIQIPTTYVNITFIQIQ